MEGSKQHRKRRSIFTDRRGQATVEAAFLLPCLFMLVLLLLQPGILLYDRMVMRGAAAEGCRLLATKTSALGVADEQYESYIRRRLGAVPSHACFHVHEGGCTWKIVLEGDETSQVASVRISTEVKPLPLIDVGATLFGLVNEQGNLVLEVSESFATQPDWVNGVQEGRDPSAWIGAWLEESMS